MSTTRVAAAPTRKPPPPHPALAALRRRWYRLLERSPRAYCAYQRWRFPERNTVGPDSDVVIEGFPGSGNSFAREAFRYANPAAVVASHRHSAAQVREAVRLGKPTIVIVRPPADAIVSCVVRFPDWTVARGLREYERFYGAIRELAADVVVARFDDVRSRYASVITTLNQRFDSSFAPFPDSDPEAVAAVTASLDRFAHEVFGAEAAWRMSPPSAEKDARKQAVRDEYGGAGFAGRRAECETLYRELVG